MKKSIGVEYKFDLEERVVHQLILRSSYLADIGLFTGKMGVVIFFFHYALREGKERYNEFAECLLDQIWEEIGTISFETGLAQGLSGIGWGIEYLIQNKFVEGNANEICEEIDSRIMEKDLRRQTDYSIETGICGLLHYVLARLKERPDPLPFDSLYLKDLYDLSIKLLDTQPDWDIRCLVTQYVDFYSGNKKIEYQLSPSLFINNEIKIDDSDLQSMELSLKSGGAGFLYRRLF